MTYGKKKEEESMQKTHPVWRGIGCVMMMIIPIISFAGGDVLLNKFLKPEGLVSLPYEFRGDFYIEFMDWYILDWKAVLAIAVILALGMYVVLLILNSMIYGMTQNRNLKRFESDPTHFKKKKR